MAIQNYFALTGKMYDRKTVFQRVFPDQLWQNMRNFLINLRDLPVWKDRSMSSTIFSAKQGREYWMHVFQTGSTKENVPVLAKPLNVAEMIAAAE